MEKKKDAILTLLLIFADATGGKYPAFFAFFLLKKRVMIICEINDILSSGTTSFLKPELEGD